MNSIEYEVKRALAEELGLPLKKVLKMGFLETAKLADEAEKRRTAKPPETPTAK
jgi:hypothetical protein